MHDKRIDQWSARQGNLRFPSVESSTCWYSSMLMNEMMKSDMPTVIQTRRRVQLLCLDWTMMIYASSSYVIGSYLFFSQCLLASSTSVDQTLMIVQSINDYLCKTHLLTCFFRQRHHREQTSTDQCRSLLILRSCLYYDDASLRICHRSTLKQVRISLMDATRTDCVASSSHGHLYSMAPTLSLRTYLLLFLLVILLRLEWRHVSAIEMCNYFLQRFSQWDRQEREREWKSLCPVRFDDNHVSSSFKPCLLSMSSISFRSNAVLYRSSLKRLIGTWMNILHVVRRRKTLTSKVEIRLSLVRNWKNSRGSMQRDRDLKEKKFIAGRRQRVLDVRSGQCYVEIPMKRFED